MMRNNFKLNKFDADFVAGLQLSGGLVWRVLFFFLVKYLEIYCFADNPFVIS
jgi:hypothetical protein